MVKPHVLSKRLENESHITGFVPGSELERAKGCYFGIGLSNNNGLTEHMPFDALGLVLTAELIRQRAELDKATILVADENAMASHDADSVRQIAGYRTDFTRRLLDSMELDFDILLASEIPKSETALGNRYERLQVSDMEFFRRTGSPVKIGWQHTSMDFDERRFDNLYARIFGPVTSFVYTEPGRALDGTAMPPYLCTGKPRLLFLDGEDISGKVDQMTAGTRAYFIRLLDLYEKLVCGHTGNGRNCPDKLKRRLREVYSTVYGNRWQ